MGPDGFIYSTKSNHFESNQNCQILPPFQIVSRSVFFKYIALLRILIYIIFGYIVNVMYFKKLEQLTI